MPTIESMKGLIRCANCKVKAADLKPRIYRDKHTGEKRKSYRRHCSDECEGNYLLTKLRAVRRVA